MPQITPRSRTAPTRRSPREAGRPNTKVAGQGAAKDAHQTMLDVTASNLANVDTTGYKAQSVEFSDELSQLVSAASTPNGYSAGTNPVQVGLGVRVRLDR
ncbi:MAG: flagellar basal body protein [Solirubrobacteraceae bacterium]